MAKTLDTTSNYSIGKKAYRHALARREARLAFILLIPTLTILFVTSFYPLSAVFVNSLTDREFGTNKPYSYIGFENYRSLLSIKIVEVPRGDDGDYVNAVSVLPREPRRYRLYDEINILGKRYAIGATDPDFIQATVDTFKFVTASVILETILGMFIALIVNTNFPLRGTMRIIMLVPWAIPTVVSARIWQWMFASSRVGFFNTAFAALGIGDGYIPFLIDRNWQLPALVIIDVWKTTPFIALLLLAGLQVIPNELYEAAQMDGANKIRQFRSITLPMLRPVIAVALVFRTLDAIRVFDLFQVLVAKQRYSMATFSYYELVHYQQMGKSSASSVVIFLMIFVFAVLYIRLLGVQHD
jgi:trehalose/maltose transport system permease protein